MIDITFDFRIDATGEYPDPDASSPTLLRYHRMLWSKPLPSGKHFELTPRWPRPYALLHDSELGKFLLTGDSVLPTFTRRPDMQAIVGQLPPADIDALNTITHTIGGMVLWPGDQIDGKWTLLRPLRKLRRVRRLLAPRRLSGAPGTDTWAISTRLWSRRGPRCLYVRAREQVVIGPSFSPAAPSFASPVGSSSSGMVEFRALSTLDRDRSPVRIHW